MMAGTQPPVDLRGFEPPLSLWQLVKSRVPEHEHEEIKDLLGSSLVEQSLELHEEITTLLEIWREFRSDNDNVNNTQNRLPEPPAARERLCQEINFFVESLRERANESGRDEMEIFSHHKSEVLEYVLDSGRPSTASSRPSTARSSRDGRETPLLRGATPTSDRYSQASNLSEEVDSIESKLNYLLFDEVVQNLRNTLEDEVKRLVSDITFLQECLDDEATWRDQSLVQREPTLTDLRGERTLLEKELLHDKSPVLPTPPNRGQFPGLPTSAGKLRPRPVVKPSSAGSTSAGPVRASHQVAGRVLTKDFPAGQPKALRKEQSKSAQSTHPSSGVGSVSSQLSKTSDSTTSGNTASAKIVPVGSVRLNSTGDSEGAFTPSPPSQARPASNRPTSANRFRHMVMSCRDNT